MRHRQGTRLRSDRAPRHSGVAVPVVVAVVASALVASVAPSGGRARGQAAFDVLVRQVHQSGCQEGREALASMASGGDLEAKRASHLLGWCQMRAGRYADAATAYRAAAGHPSLRTLARIGGAGALAGKGEHAAATALAREAAGSTRDSLRARALTELGEAELALKHPAPAADALATAAELRSSDPAVWRLFGDAAAPAGRRDMARGG